MIRNLVTIGDERLGKRSSPVEKIDDTIISLVDDMSDTMYNHNGIGLAAVQIGFLLRLFVIDIPDITDELMVFINPEIKKKSTDLLKFDEGCLSIPELRYEINRSRSLILSYRDLEGKNRELEATDILSVCIQHELDHINGRLFIENARSKEQKRINKLLREKNLPSFF